MFKFIKSPLGNALVMLSVVTFIGVSVVLNSLRQGDDGDFTEASEEYNYKPTVTTRHSSIQDTQPSRE